MSRVVIPFLIATGVVTAQLPKDLSDRLADSRPDIREMAVSDLGRLSPRLGLPPDDVARLLSTALRDEHLGVRISAARNLSARCPADIAVPALLDALASVDRPMKRTTWIVLRTPRGDYAQAILGSLGEHRDERAVSGVVATLRSWPIEQFPGATVRVACGTLCRWGTRLAIGAVVEVLKRIECIPVPPEESCPPSWPTCPPPRSTFTFRCCKDGERLTRPDDWIEIAKMLDSALMSAGIEYRGRVGPLSAKSYTEVIAAEVSKLPRSLAESRPTTRPKTSSRPAAGK
jgi:hypothetical protein